MRKAISCEEGLKKRISLYDLVQCHRSSQFCWCVNPETGTPLQGMSKYNGKPNCSGKDARYGREIKGRL
uniref:Thyroglobulin type-1 domain-containing protein n=1 Tax=Parascaris equorum TaxID=6256 RepID=A0A914R0B8_PAREQ